ncbi:MAG: hypothetical protein KC613_21610, partial [Myxococcales bacterium]|nr:hypothetical protein [Myxococcales bacterium]
MLEASTQLYVHSRRPEWGLAREAGEQAGKVRFVFQDGHERAFHRRFAHLMVPADKPADVVQKVAEDLDQRSGGVTVAERHDRDDIPTFEEQVAVFKHLYPAGFADPAYIEAVRGGDGTRRRKKHRDPAVADAAARLSPEAFEAAEP